MNSYKVKMSDSYLEVSISITPVDSSESQDSVCRQCGQCFVSKSELETHESSHPAYKLPRCTHCSMCFQMEEKLKEHTQTKHGVQVTFTDLTAESSNSEAISKNVVEVKMSDAHDVHYYRCEQCAKGFVSKSELEMHQASHPVEKLLRCKDCCMYFQGEEKLHKHTQEKHGVLLQESSELSENSPGINPLECGQDDGSTVEQYSCGLCGKKYVSKSELEKHVCPDLTEKLLRCKDCGMYFQIEARLQRHAQKKHGVQGPLLPIKINQPTYNKAGTKKHAEHYECTHCGKSFNNQNRLQQHERKQHTGELPFQCSYCSKSFRIQSQRTVHERSHTGEKPFSCDQCSKSFQTASHLRYHEQSHNDSEKRYKCSYCSKSFRIQSQRTVHERSHTGEKPFSCDQCSKSFQTTSHLRYHEQSHNDSDKRYKCSYCDSSYFSLTQLKLHVRGHTGEKPFKCTYCDKCFSCKSSLQSHQQTHAEVPKPYNCTHCDKRFVSMYKLKKHKRSHTGEKPFKCTYCDKCFSCKSSLRDHQQIHAEVPKPYNCTHCDKKFVSLYKLKDHKRYHTIERPHKCSKCSLSFLSKSNLARHERLPHDKNRFVKFYHTQFRGYRDTKCTQCDKVFKHPYQLRVHQVFHSTEKNFKCELCSYSSKYHSGLKRHIIWKHKQDKPIECPICKKVLKNSISLSDHKRRVHDPEKSQRMQAKERNFKCGLCSRSFKYSNNLKEHIKRHENEPMECNHCKNIFKNSVSLSQHIRRVQRNSEKTHKCSQCGKLFRSVYYLESHIKLTHQTQHVELATVAEKYYRCEQCGQYFASKSQLETHQSSHPTEKVLRCKDCGCYFEKEEKLNEHVQIMHRVRDSFIATNSAGISPLDSGHNFGTTSNDASLIFAEQCRDNELDPSDESSSSAHESEDSDSETADMVESAVGLQMEVFVLEDAI